MNIGKVFISFHVLDGLEECTFTEEEYSIIKSKLEMLKEIFSDLNVYEIENYIVETKKSDGIKAIYCNSVVDNNR